MKYLSIFLALFLAISCGEDAGKKTRKLNNKKRNINNKRNTNNKSNTNNKTQTNGQISGTTNTNGQTSGTTNNINSKCAVDEKLAQVNGNEPKCYKKCNAGTCKVGRCVTGICLDDQTNSCKTNADCGADQECKTGCEDHHVCESRFISRANFRDVFWKNCSDSREYRLLCQPKNGSWECECKVNDVTTGTFTEGAKSNKATLHRAANLGCDWLVPKIQ